MLVQEHLEICSYHDKEEYLEREWSKDITWIHEKLWQIGTENRYWITILSKQIQATN